MTRRGRNYKKIKQVWLRGKIAFSKELDLKAPIPKERTLTKAKVFVKLPGILHKIQRKGITFSGKWIQNILTSKNELLLIITPQTNRMV